MKTEEKQLILKDLCGRLPYSPLVYLSNPMDSFDSELCTTVIEHLINEEYEVKPYLFPLSSMTPKQKAELAWLVRDEENLFRIALIESDFYNKNHIDYRGLIERGLAIDATKLNIYKL